MEKNGELNLPGFDIRLRRDEDSRRGGSEVYDALRRKWVALTPEEWVRQHFVNYLVSHCGYPAGLMGNEVSLRLNGTLRRCDTVVFSKSLRPVVVIEYKAPDVAITQAVFDQIARYNVVMQSRYLMVSNGMRHYCCRYSADGGYVFLRSIPSYSELCE